MDHALALASGNSTEFLLTYLACGKSGVVCVPTNHGRRLDEIAHALGDSAAGGPRWWPW